MFFEVDPVEILPANREGLRKAVEACLTRSFVQIPERDRFASADWPSASVVQRAAGFRTWKGFAAKSLSVALIGSEKHWEISIGKGNDPSDVELVRLDRQADTDALVASLEQLISKHLVGH
jgi:hypothetical protein